MRVCFFVVCILDGYWLQKKIHTGGKTFFFTTTKLFSRRENIFSRRENLFSRRENKFSRHENCFIPYAKFFCFI
jgi:hypothetical protein